LRPITKIENKNVFSSWSGGKDSALALYLAAQEGYVPRFLVTMMTEDGKRTRAHGLPLSIIQAQASSLQISLITRKTTWEDYEKTFLSVLHGFKEGDIAAGVFGDIDIDAHKEWTERLCASISIESYEPLWKKPRIFLLETLIGLGFKATIVSLKSRVMDKSFLGKTLDRNLIKEISKTGIDPSGENGEYHTVVTDGPLFSHPIKFDLNKPILKNGYWVLTS